MHGQQNIKSRLVVDNVLKTDNPAASYMLTFSFRCTGSLTYVNNTVDRSTFQTISNNFTIRGVVVSSV
jgi:hypothetical protein